MTPSESLNIPEVYFGCLRVLSLNEGEHVNSKTIFNLLQQVEKDIKDYKDINVSLARSEERNLFRNSGQYWKNTGTLLGTDYGIRLTDFGRSYSSGKITKDEFSAIVIKSMELPNPFIESDETIAEWHDEDVKLKPLELILSLIYRLYNYKCDQGYLTTKELVEVVIPMAGNKATEYEIYKVILDCRHGATLGIDSWKANEKSNDKRMAREFFLFLENYGYLNSRPSQSERGNNLTQEFYLTDYQHSLAKSLLNSPEISYKSIAFDNVVSKLAETTEVIARKRVMTEITLRPKQAEFRKKLMKAYSGKCLLSNASISEVLQACHIIPVKNNGDDAVENGFILRSDLHLLYDSGHIKICEDGKVVLSDYLRQDDFYRTTLPRKVELPKFLNIENIRIRNEYNM
ncbi:HNH endonuclease [Phytobacter diazotrophicus]|uniref:HNH endonuclease n=1 Tax=Phytobacter diazotrophicus TaxID=395631 RepID=UPI001C9A2A8F|nr:HNH endonuclease [Phytobacter diazotrophicus]MBY6259698.1 HNH endonuclease [Phytobacter diazotrophicus]